MRTPAFIKRILEKRDLYRRERKWQDLHKKLKTEDPNHPEGSTVRRWDLKQEEILR